MKNNPTQSVNSEYPYGEFPYNYTVIGQEKMFERIKSQAQDSSDNIGNNISQSNTNITPNNATSNVHTLDLKSLLPTIIKMQNGDFDTKDLLKLISPMISSDLPIGELVNLFNNKPKKNTLKALDDPNLDDLRPCSE